MALIASFFNARGAPPPLARAAALPQAPHCPSPRCPIAPLPHFSCGPQGTPSVLRPAVIPEKSRKRGRLVYGTGLAETVAVITTKTLVVALASSACLAAAGAGGYMAVRTNSAARPVEAVQSAPAPQPAPAIPDAAPSTTVEIQPEKTMPVVRTEPRERTPREPAPAPKPRPQPVRPAAEAPPPSAAPATPAPAVPAPPQSSRRSDAARVGARRRARGEGTRKAAVRGSHREIRLGDRDPARLVDLE